MSAPAGSLAVRLVAGALVLGALAAVAFAPNTYWLFVLGMAGCFAIVGYGLNLLIGLCGQVSIGHAGFFALGAYTAGVLSVRYGWPVLTTLPVAVLLGMLLGAVLAAPALRVRGPYLAMVTIAFGLVFENVLIEAEPLTGGFNGLSDIDKPTVAGVAFGMRGLALVIVLCTVATAFGYARLAASRFGRRLRAVRDAEVAARAIGLDPVRLRTQAFALSAGAAALGGALFAPLAGFISPENFGLLQSILFLLLTIVGGVGTVTGPAVGALIVAGLPELLSALADWRLMIFGLALLLILRLRPEGLAAFWERDGSLPMAAAADAPGDAGRALAWLSAGARPGMLRLRELGLSFGGLTAVDAVSFDVAAGQVRGLIGPNGAGKTSLLNMVGGFYRPQRGQLTRGETPLTGRPSHRMRDAGIARTFQAAQLFGSLSVHDNLALALPGGAPAGMIADLLSLVGYDRDPSLQAAALPFVDRRLVEIARALACQPDTLLLDETAAGLSADEKARLGALLRRLAATGLRVILVEHDVPLVMQSCDRIAVLDSGRLIADGAPDAVRVQPAVIAAYLGGADSLPVRALRPTPADTTAPVLSLEGLAAGYGALPVLAGLSMRVAAGEVVALIGANGAGKSTLMRVLSGLLPARGTLRWQGQPLETLPAHRRVAAGLVLVPEGRQVFPESSVHDNLLLGGWTRSRTERDAGLAAMLALFPRLEERLPQRAGTLSGGEQQMLALARALMAQPTLLMLDEPSLGLAPRLVSEVYATVARLADEGRTLLLVDQFARTALAVADRGYVLAGGRIAAEGPAGEMLASGMLSDAYLGAQPAAGTSASSAISSSVAPPASPSSPPAAAGWHPTSFPTPAP